MRVVFAVTLALIALQCVHGQTNTTTEDPTPRPTEEPTTAVPTTEQPTAEPTIYFTSTEFYMDTTMDDMETTVDLCDSFLPLIPDADDDVTDDNTECLFQTEATLDATENIVATICGFKNQTSDKVYVSVTLSLPSDIWFGVGFITTGNFNTQQRMAGYAVIAPACGRDLEERFLTGKGVDGLGTTLTSSITVFEDTIDEMTRTLRFTRPLTVEISDIDTDQTGDNLLAIHNGEYFDFSVFQECDTEIKVIYAFGSTNWDASLNNYHQTNRGDITAVMMEVDDELCPGVDDEESAAYSFSIGRSIAFVSLLAGVLLLQ